MSNFQVEEKSIKELQAQIEISTEHATILLKKHKGDLFNAVMDAFELSDGNTSVLEDTSNNESTEVVESEDTTQKTDEENIENARKVLEDKDKLYQKNTGPQIDLTGVRLYRYVTVTRYHNVELHNEYAEKNMMLQNVIFYFLEKNCGAKYLPKRNDKQHLFSVILNNNNTLTRKYAFNKPMMFYFERQFVENKNITKSHPKNKIVTQLLKDEGILKPGWSYVGGAIIVSEFVD